MIQQIRLNWIIKVICFISWSRSFSMDQQSKQNQLTIQQKYFLCYQSCFWIFQIIIFALGLALMAQVIIAYTNTKTVLASTQYQHAQQTVGLWQQGYIIDIRAENTNNCPQGYSPLITYTWPGTVTGCHCTSGTNGYNFDFVLLGQCSSNLVSLGCQNVAPVSPQTLNMWKGSSLICFKRAKSMNFYNSIMTSAPTGGSSPSMTACAVGQNYQVYTLPGVPCPISAASNQTLGSSQTQLTLDASNGYYLNFVSESGYPISNIKLTQYNFCEFFNQINISPNKAGNYILEQQSINSPCSANDPRMVTIDQLDEESFYTNNTRVYQLLTELPSYPKPSVDYRYLLGYIPYPSWTYQCRVSTPFNLYIATTHLLFTNTSNSLVVTTSVTIPCLLILVFLFRIYFIIRHVIDFKARKTYNAMMLTDDEIIEQLPNLQIKKSFKKQFILFLIELLLLLGTVGSIIYSIVNTTNDSLWIKQIVKNKCTDQYLQNIFLYYESIIDQISMILVKACFIWGAIIILQIIFFVTRNKIGDLYSKKQVIVESSIPSVQQQPLKILQKQGNIEGTHMNQSELAINKQANSQIKIFDVDYLMGDGGAETKDNFYNALQRQASINVVKKKKKKKQTVGSKKKKNLFKDDQL